MTWLALREEIAEEFGQHEGAGFEFEQNGITFGRKNAVLLDSRHRREEAKFEAVCRRLERRREEQLRIRTRHPHVVKGLADRRRELEARHFLPGRLPLPFRCECGEAFGTPVALRVHRARMHRRDER